MMKKIVFFMAMMLSNRVLACPNLQGKWNCRGLFGWDIMTIDQAEHSLLIQLRERKFMINADGLVRQIEYQTSNGSITLNESASCVDDEVIHRAIRPEDQEVAVYYYLKKEEEYLSISFTEFLDDTNGRWSWWYPAACNRL